MRTMRSLIISLGSSLAVLALGGMTTGCILDTDVGFDSDTGGSGGGATAGGAGSSGGVGGSGGDADTGGPGGGANGGPEVLFETVANLSVCGETNAFGIVVDAHNVYFTDNQGTDSNVLSVPKEGGTVTVLASNVYDPSGIAVDAAYVYFVDTSAVRKVPIGGGPVTALADAENAAYSAVAVDDDNVYWTNYAGLGSTMQIPKAGGPPITLDGGSHYPAGVLVTGGSVYWTAFSDYAIESAPVGGGPVVTIAADQPAPRWGLAADDTRLYWITEGTFPMEIWSVPLDAGAPPALLGLAPSDWASATSLLVDAEYAYFSVDCSIVRLPIGGGEPLITTVDEALGCPRFMTQDAENVYYTSTVGVTRYPKSAL